MESLQIYMLSVKLFNEFTSGIIFAVETCKENPETIRLFWLTKPKGAHRSICSFDAYICRIPGESEQLFNSVQAAVPIRLSAWDAFYSVICLVKRHVKVQLR